MQAERDLQDVQDASNYSDRRLFPQPPIPDIGESFDEMEAAARAICVAALKGQLDKCGVPYYLHPFAVASECHGTARIVAYLHDVVEDTALTLDDLRLCGMPDSVIGSVDAITRRPGESYAEYIDRVALDEIAVLVKVADLHHNLSESRSAGMTDSRRERYLRALSVLNPSDELLSCEDGGKYHRHKHADKSEK